MGFAGDPEIIEAVAEARRCTEQMRSEPVRQDPQQVQVLLKRFKVLCARLTRAARKGAHAFCSLQLINVVHIYAWAGAVNVGGAQHSGCQHPSPHSGWSP